MKLSRDRTISIEACHCMALRRAARRVSEGYDEALAPSGLRATQFSILALLAGEGGLTVNELAQRLELDRTTTGKNLRPLHRDNLVEVRVSRIDRRSRAIALTTTGRDRLRLAAPLWSAAQQQFEAAHGKRRSRALRDQVNSLQTA